MQQQNLNNSIILLGPPCVGKTLISEALSAKINMPVVSIDDLILLIGEEMDGCLDSSLKQQKWFVRDIARQIMSSPEHKETLTNPKYIDTQTQLIKKLVDLYNLYHDLLGDLKPFYPIIEQNRQTISCANTPDYMITSLNEVTNKIIKLILEKVDQPIIIDTPGSYGWQFLTHLETDTKTKLMMDLKLRPTQTQKQMNEIISSTQSVLLLPGEDFEKRNSEKHIATTNMLVSNLDSYIETDVMLSCNGLFYSTDSKYFQQRKYLDAREFLEKKKQLNNAEITNICDQILCSLNEIHHICATTQG